MTTDDRITKARERYLTAAHAVQSGVAMEMTIPARASATEPKHLRVGVNTALVEGSAVAKLLMAKGVFTEVEYYEAIAEAMEAEKLDYEERLSGQFGNKVTLV